MRRQFVTYIVLASVMLAVQPDHGIAQDFQIGRIQFDKLEWGQRRLIIPVDNFRDDTARMVCMIQTIFPQHYISGLERLTVDTSFVVPPHSSDNCLIPVELPGSYGRMMSRVIVYWRFDHPRPEDRTPDSVMQVFKPAFVAHGPAMEYAEKRHSVGPVYSIMDHHDMNFEYPRLVLFLLSRGRSLAEIGALFEADPEYTGAVIKNLRADGLFPLASDTLAPGILAIEEAEAYAVKPKLDSAAKTFASWYTTKGEKQLSDILRRAGLDDYVAGLPSLRLSILLTLLEESSGDTAKGVMTPVFDNMDADLAMQNRPRWIVQGGEFFLPRLCLAAFADKGQLYYGSFSPDPTLPFDKAPIYDFRKLAEESGDAIPVIEASQMREILRQARQTGMVKDIAGVFKQVIAGVQTDIKRFKSYQTPYLADYVYAVVLGAYFAGQKNAKQLDCFQVRFSS
jgi:hypothetical protein